jgi:hypothetical protein
MPKADRPGLADLGTATADLKTHQIPLGVLVEKSEGLSMCSKVLCLAQH